MGMSIVSTDANGRPFIDFRRNTSTAIGTIQAGLNDAFGINGDNLFIENPVAGGKIILRDSTGNGLVQSAGNVGIGTTSPNAKLQIESSTLTTPNAQPLVLTAPTTAIGDKLGISFAQTDNYSRARAGIYSIAELANGYASSLGFFTRNAEDGSQLGNTDEKMRITSAGKVGIGTTNPWAKLQVQDGTFVIGDTAQGSAASFSYSAGKLLIGLDSAGTDGIYFREYIPGTGYAENMVIKNTGKVGIGTTSPEGTLDVYGVGYFGFQDYRTQNTQKVLVLRAEPVSGSYSQSRFNFYTTPGTTDNGVSKLTIKSQYAANAESGELFTLAGNGYI